MQRIQSKSVVSLALAVLLLVPTVSFAVAPRETAMFFNGPTVSNVTDTTATLSLSPAVLASLTDEEKARVYFEYRETYQMCIMIYPTPEYCLPKKSAKGNTSAQLAGLKPNTSYTVTYKMDNSIYCITTPCPGNEFESLSVEFVTKQSATTTPPAQGKFKKNIWFRNSGSHVTELQTVLFSKGYLTIQPTGYFGMLTLRAVKEFQKDNGIPPTGYVGVLTRAALMKDSAVVEETFEGTITAYSTQCFVDGECSITVDGKKVVTTTGWSQQIVGSVRGIADFGSIEKKIGEKAKVYAKKTESGYTLYGNAKYYIEVQ